MGGHGAGRWAVLFLAAACGGEAGTGPGAGPVVRDSAGIPIVESRGPAWEAGDAWLVDAQPVLRVGTLDGPPETQFARLTGTGLLDDGTVVVADAGNARISAFGLDGTLRWSQGREGEGPGEYGQLGSLHRLTGDSVMVYDFRTRRVTVLSPGGALARSYVPTPPEGSFMNAPLGEVAPGVLAATGGSVFGAGETPDGSRMERRPERFFIAGSQGEVLDTLPTLLGPEMWMIAQGNAISVWTVPFGRDAVMETGPGVVAGGVTERPEWRMWDASGALLRVIRLDVPARPVTAEDWDRAREAQIPEGADAARRSAVRDAYDAIPAPESWPAFSDLAVDDGGYLWVERFAAPWDGDTPRAWWVFDPSGVLLGEVALPAGFEVDAIRGHRLVGRWEDELGVPEVRVYRIVGR
ncbi:MAG TPA: hypothetical protein VLA43_04755 [Longimicrobiales bacterium]|nr:hypothetical protein [Longimicrobiales bacterium]